MRELSRRAVLAAGVGVSAAALSGCGVADVFGLRHPVKVAVTWSATELRAFNAVLDRLGPLGYDVEVLPLGDDIAAAFGPRAQRPDIVMMPQPGTVMANASRLATVPAGDWPYAPGWDELRRGNQAALGLPFKMANESVVWYRKSVFARVGVAVPDRWSRWLEANQRIAASGVPPLAVAAADGWILTQTFDNVLLGCAGQDVHRGLVDGTVRWTHPGVLRALRLLGRMWAAPGVLAGRVDGSLVQQFPDAVLEVFGHQRAAMVVAPDFADSVIRQFGQDPDDVGAFRFPSIDGDPIDPVAPRGSPPVVIGGDIAVLPAPASDDARDLLGRLAAPAAPLPWIRDYGGFIAANELTSFDAYRSEERQLATDLAQSKTRPIFNLSDSLGAIGGREGLWRVLQDFLTRVGERGPDVVDGAARDAAARMAKLAG